MNQQTAKTYEEVSFETKGLTITGKRWNSGSSKKMLALHGWLDNCASFDLLAPELQGVDLIALDLAGHGTSSFRSADSNYLIWTDVAEIFDIADTLEWQNFYLMGHSRGAAIATLCAGTFPDRIIKLILIEGGVPHHDGNTEPANLAEHIIAAKRIGLRKPTCFATAEDAINARANGMLRVNQHAAMLLATRGVLETEQGFYWNNDPNLKTPSALRLPKETIQRFIMAITAPILVILGIQGILKANEYQSLIDKMSSATFKELSGGHHLHVEEQAQDCAEEINNFI